MRARERKLRFRVLLEKLRIRVSGAETVPAEGAARKSLLLGPERLALRLLDQRQVACHHAEQFLG